MAESQQSDLDLGIVRFEYGDPARPQRAVLKIETSKHYNGGLISDAMVYWVGGHCRQRLVGLGDNGGDYGNRLKISAKTVKATQRAIDAQHAEIFTPETVAQLVRGAKAHYLNAIRNGVDGFRNTYPPFSGKEDGTNEISTDHLLAGH